MYETVTLRGRRLQPFGVIVPARRFGVGDPDVTQTSGYQAAWSQIQGQLTSEGSPPGSLQSVAAATALQNSWGTLVTTGGMLGDPQGALNAAAKYVLNGSTIAGAADQVSGLIAAATSGAPPAALMQAFTGTMIGVGVAAGAISAGVGAAIVGAIDVALTLLQQAGLFGSTPTGTQYCPGQYLNGGVISYMLPGQANPNNGQQNCIGVLDPYVAPGSALGTNSSRWRHFPSQGNAQDLVWWAQTQPWAGGSLQWTPHAGDQSITYLFGSDLSNTPSGQLARAIDLAFPVYHQIECEAAAGQQLVLLSNFVPITALQALTDFQNAWYAALKLNWEYALNGLKPQPDWQVLINHVRNWNKAHDSSSTYQLFPSSATPWTVNGPPTCSGIPPWYAQIAASGVVSNPPADIMGPNNASVQINVGAKKNFTLSGLGQGATAPATSSSSSSSAGKVLVVAGLGAGAAAGGLAYYAHTQGITMGQALKRLFR